MQADAPKDSLFRVALTGGEEPHDFRAVLAAQHPDLVSVTNIRTTDAIVRQIKEQADGR